MLRSRFKLWMEWILATNTPQKGQLRPYSMFLPWCYYWYCTFLWAIITEYMNLRKNKFINTKIICSYLFRFGMINHWSKCETCWKKTWNFIYKCRGIKKASLTGNKLISQRQCCAAPRVSSIGYITTFGR